MISVSLNFETRCIYELPMFLPISVEYFSARHPHNVHCSVFCAVRTQSLCKCPLQRLGAEFYPRSLMRKTGGKQVESEEVFVLVLRFFPVTTIPLVLHTHLNLNTAVGKTRREAWKLLSRGMLFLLWGSTGQKYSLTLLLLFQVLRNRESSPNFPLPQFFTDTQSINIINSQVIRHTCIQKTACHQEKRQYYLSDK